MNKRQVIILWAVAAVLGIAVAAVKLSNQDSTHSSTRRSAGQTLFESFPATDAAKIEIVGAGDKVTLTKENGKWTVSERDGYPANTTFVNEFIRTLGDLKVTLALEAGPSFAPRFGMDEASSVAAERGLTATFKDASGQDLAKVSLGKTIESNSGSSPMDGGSSVGRYIRNHADESGFYGVSEMFPSVSIEANRWLDESFLNVEKIKTISVTQPDKQDLAWSVTRAEETAEFKLVGATATEVLDSAAASSLNTLFAYSRFEDVVPKDKVEARAATEGKRTVTLETFEGFRYTLTLTPTKAQATPPATLAAPGTPPPATDNFLMTVSLSAELPKERKKEENEKPDDAKAKDTAFAERKKTLEERLAKEKTLEGRTFEVTKSSVESLLKERSAMITQATPPPATDATQGNVQSLPGGIIAQPPSQATTAPVEAVTPPISVPAAEPQTEEKPANKE